MERANATEWAKRVERWKDSGLTAKEFAAQCGLKASMLSYWQWKLRAGNGSRGGTSKQTSKRQAASSGSEASAGFSVTAPMRIVELPASAVASPVPCLELVLDRGVRVCVPTGFDEPTLTRLLRVVEAAR